MIIKGNVTILFNADGVSIEIHDDDAGVEILSLQLDEKQTCQALSRLSRIPCELEMHDDLSVIGKVQERKPFEFQLPADIGYGDDRKKLAIKTANKSCPAGWKAANYYGSQGSFFTKDDKPWARTHIYRWVEKNKKEEK